MAPTLKIPRQTKSRNPMISAMKTPIPKPLPPVCFSFAAYANTIINHLQSLNVSVSSGLTDCEISDVESALRFSFPPDLRLILQVGLPVGRHFPNWRGWSILQLRVLLNLPILYLSKNVVRNGFWVGSWEPRPENDDAALSLVKKLLEHAPVLVPVYGNFYVPSTTPKLAGNPVFHVDGDGVRVLSIDVSGFFQRFDSFSPMGDVNTGIFYCFDVDRISGRRKKERGGNLPAWAATEARRVEFWTEVAERGRRMTAYGNARGWWSVEEDDRWCLGLRTCLDDVFGTLRDGGWKEAEIREMMMMDGCDESKSRLRTISTVDDAKEIAKILSQVLLRAGWSRGDVVYSLDLDQDEEINGHDQNDPDDSFVMEAKSCFELRHQNLTSCCSIEEDNPKRRNTTSLLHLLSLEA